MASRAEPGQILVKTRRPRDPAAMFLTRPDGKRVRGVSALRAMMPFLMPTRNESVVYFEQEIDLSRTLPYLEQLNGQPQPAAQAPGSAPTPINLFHLLLCAYVRTWTQRPHLNRFVVGSRIFERDHIEFSFAIKKQLTDHAALTTAKVRFEPGDTLRSVADKCQAAVRFGRGDKPSRSDQEVALITRLPRFVVRLVMWAQRALDAWNLLPAGLIRPDPLYASLFLANLGSIGLDSAYHHLFEYGTCSVFAVIGRVKKTLFISAAGEPVVRDGVNVKYTYDERITDGLYCSTSLALFKSLVEDPQQLEAPPVA